MKIVNLDTMIKEHTFHGFPVLQNLELIGYVTRDKLMTAIEFLLSRDPAPSPERKCTFSRRRFASEGDEFENLSEVIEEALLQLRKELPQELVVNMFQKLVSVSLSVYSALLIHVSQNLRHIVFTQEGKLVGMITKTDIVALLNLHFPHTAALSEPPSHF